MIPQVKQGLITPPFLKQNDIIGIAAPARKISPQELQPAITLLESWGLNVVLASNIFDSYHQYAGTDEQRINGLQEFLDNDNIKAVFFARGGYGCIRIIDKLDFSNFIRHPKWIMGYSDITILHSHIQSNFGIETLHSTMAINIPTNTAASLESVRMALFGKKIFYEIAPHQFNRLGKVSGVLIGGNMSILYALAGSVSDIQPHGRILFIEDLEEYLYHIDRMMFSLKRSGKLKYLAGIIIGGMNNMNDNAVPFGKEAYEIIKESVSEHNIPVCFGFPAGHIDDNRALILGRKIILHVDEKACRITF